jgi:flagellar export protein FliJ
MSKLRTVARVLDLKDWKKEEIENEVKHLRAQINKLEAQLDSVEKKFIDTINEFEEKQRSCEMDVHRLGLFSSYFMGLSEEMDARKREIMRRLSELHERQNALIAAYKDKKLVEILKDRIVKEDTTHKEKAAQKEQDFLHLAKRQRER